MMDQGTAIVEDESRFGALLGEAQTRRFGLSLVLTGWVHLAIFLLCEFLFLQGDRAAIHFLPLWGLDLGLAVLLFRGRIPGLQTIHSHSLARVTVRVWLTFAILCFTSASLNSLTGFAIDWFKISWAMLGTFAFATMAWIFHLAFLIPAVQMSITACLVASYPNHAYLILGVSGWLVLNALGLLLEKQRWSSRWVVLTPRRAEFGFKTRAK